MNICHTDISQYIKTHKHFINVFYNNDKLCLEIVEYFVLIMMYKY